MENIVVFDEFTDKDLRPAELLEKYRQLTKRDVERFLVKGKQLVTCACPACRAGRFVKAFDRYGLTYAECLDCGTLYVSPRPGSADLRDYYRKSEAIAFWRDEVSRYTMAKRKEKIIQPRFQWIVDSVQEHRPAARCFVDINTKQQEYVDAIAGMELFGRKVLLDPYLVPGPDLHGRAVDVIDRPWWESGLRGEADVVTLFEAGDHVADIDQLLEAVDAMLVAGGLLFMTHILISGFDLQVLWDRAEYLFPPDRLNVFSVEGLRRLCDRHGFECCELSTPGILDVEIVDKALRGDKTVVIPRFFRYIMEKRDEMTKRSFQEFLQSCLLSSYGKVLLKKKN